MQAAALCACLLFCAMTAERIERGPCAIGELLMTNLSQQHSIFSQSGAHTLAAPHIVWLPSSRSLLFGAAFFLEQPSPSLLPALSPSSGCDSHKLAFTNVVVTNGKQTKNLQKVQRIQIQGGAAWRSFLHVLRVH